MILLLNPAWPDILYTAQEGLDLYPSATWL